MGAALHFKLRRGLDIPLAGQPEQRIHEGPLIRSAALLGLDYHDLQPELAVEQGQRVRLGDLLFTDRKNPGLRGVAPGSGEVTAINRGPRRRLNSVVLRLDGSDDDGPQFPAHEPAALPRLARERIVETLVRAGLWSAFRTRPYSKVPLPDAVPAAILVTAMDTNPLAADPRVIIGADPGSFEAGLGALLPLARGPVYLCQAPGAALPAPDDPRLVVAEFAGPHPAGLPGTHVHFLEPVSLDRSVWVVGYQDVIAIGRLFTAGRLSVERIVALGGPMLQRPRLVRTRAGASVDDLLGDELPPVECRVISGSPLAGRRAAGWAAFLGRYHTQLTVLAEGRQRELFGWIRPGRNKFSAMRVFVSSLAGRRRRFALNTSQNGSPRAMVPLGVYESVMPQDLLPTQLLRALVVQDTETARQLGCLELDEEDLALCSFVCPGKYDYGPALRENLALIEKEG